MLACLQRPNRPQPLPCAAHILEAPLRHTGEPKCPRYPSVAELNAYAQRTADSPLSIQIFPANVRVPQHKQISRTVNGLDTRLGPCTQPYAGGHQGLLAIVSTSAMPRGLLKSSGGKRTKLSPIQMAVAPYAPPIHRHRQRPFTSHAVVHHMSRLSNVHWSPSFPAATAASCGDSGLALAQSGLAYSGAVLPTQSADAAGSEYWPRRAQQHHPQAILQSYRGVSHPLAAGGMLDKLAVSPVVSVRQFFTPAWTGGVTDPDSDCYPQELPAAHLQLHPLGQRVALSGKSLCQAALLSSSLQSLESLISEIHPPCIKERMLGRGYEAVPQPLDPRAQIGLE